MRLSILHTLATLLSLSCLLVLAACEDHGLAPPPPPELQTEEPGFGGIITVNSPWSPPDSLFDLRVVAFLNYPPGDIIEEVTNERAIISETLSFNKDTLHYRMNTGDLSASFQYIAVVQRYGENIFDNWRAVGVYTLSGDPTLPSSIVLNGSVYIPDIHIGINFYDLPPQPF